MYLYGKSNGKLCERSHFITHQHQVSWNVKRYWSLFDWSWTILVCSPARRKRPSPGRIADGRGGQYEIQGTKISFWDDFANIYQKPTDYQEFVTTWSVNWLSWSKISRRLLNTEFIFKQGQRYITCLTSTQYSKLLATLCTYGQRRQYKSPEIPALSFFFSG